MSTGVDLGVGAAGNANGNPPPGAADGGAKGSAPPAAASGGSASPWSGLSDAHKALADAKGWKDTAALPAIFDAYSALEKKLGERPAAPTAPKLASEYEFKKPDNLPREVGYNDAFANSFRDWAHKAGLSKEQASALHDNFVGFAMQAHSTGQAEMAKALDAKLSSAEQALTKAWGATDSPAFKRSLELARRAMEQFKIGDDLKAAGVILDVGGAAKAGNANILIALSRVGQKLFAEDSVYGGSALNINPFDSKSFDTTAQGSLVKNDPNKALMMIQSLPAADRARFAYLEDKLKGSGQ